MTTTRSTMRVIDGLQPEPPQQAAGRVDAAHPLPQIKLDPRTYDRALACVHCGLCLPACPTYTQNGLEADSPRGRITLMKGLSDGRIQAEPSVLHHLDQCLDCRACETACPSGVVYHELIEETRIRLASQRPQTFAQRLITWICLHIFAYPTRLKLAMLPARVLQKIGLWSLVTHDGILHHFPLSWQKMQRLLPPDGPLWPRALAAHYSSHRQRDRGTRRVGFFAGCVGSVLGQQVNRQAIALLQHAGCDVVVPPAQRCCGAIHHHSGRATPAEQLARRNIDAFLPDDGPAVDHIVTDIAGCGAMLRDYAHLLRDDSIYAERAKQFVNRVCDISELLVTLDLPRPAHALNMTVTYHDACHLLHAQRVAQPPRQLLERIAGLTVVDLPESAICCGAAGTYNLSQPETAGQLAQRKLANIQHTGAAVCVTGNIGCAMHIAAEARQRGMALTIVHPVTLLYQATFGKDHVV